MRFVSNPIMPILFLYMEVVAIFPESSGMAGDMRIRGSGVAEAGATAPYAEKKQFEKSIIIRNAIRSWINLMDQ